MILDRPTMISLMKWPNSMNRNAAICIQSAWRNPWPQEGRTKMMGQSRTNTTEIKWGCTQWSSCLIYSQLLVISLKCMIGLPQLKTICSPSLMPSNSLKMTTRILSSMQTNKWIKSENKLNLIKRFRMKSMIGSSKALRKIKLPWAIIRK